MEYEIVLGGQLPARWEGCLGGMRVEGLANGETEIRGSIPDQEALHGILRMIRDLGLVIVSIKLLKEDKMSANLSWGAPEPDGGTP